jgi:thiosulfate/3-mercaptopyruvate sulfurtransferase
VTRANASPLIEPGDILAAGPERFRFVDGSWFLGEPGKGEVAYRQEHIPGAVHFPLDEVCDRSSDLPHMLPSPEAFAAWAGGKGLRADDAIVVYDVIGVRSAARTWWTLTVFGARNVKVLNGGLPAWKDAGGSTVSGDVLVQPTRFDASSPGDKVVSFAEMLDFSQRRPEDAPLTLDARSTGRFEGREPEPREGLSSGHMPNSASLPFTDLLDGGRMKAPDDLRALFAAKGVDGVRPVVTTCGSGVTAAVLALALVEAGFSLPRLYDGSWAEWASRAEAVILKGPQS